MLGPSLFLSFLCVLCAIALLHRAHRLGRERGEADRARKAEEAELARSRAEADQIRLEAETLRREEELPLSDFTRVAGLDRGASLINDVTQEAREMSIADRLWQGGLRYGFRLPLIIEGDWSGSINMSGRSANPFFYQKTTAQVVD